MSSSTASNRTTFVLIPGAGIDAAAWQWTIAQLRTLGYGPWPHRFRSMIPTPAWARRRAAVVDAARDLPGRLVVVGQSLGAFTAPLVAARIPVAELVLVAPMIPTPGETAGEWWSAVGHDKAIAPLVERLGPVSSWGPQELAEVFLHDVPAEIAQASEQFSRAPGPGMFREP
jgi:pimeloyl-ACP methyl ester carboxylesterase